MTKIVEQQKTEMNLRLRSCFFESAEEPNIIVHPTGKIVDANQAALDRIGLGRDQLLTMRFNDLVSIPNLDNLERILKNVRVGDTSLQSIQFLTKGGQFVKTEISIRLSELDGCEYIFVTIPEHVESYLTRHELQRITDSVPAFIGFVCKEQKYRYVNKKYEEHYGLGREQICGMTVRQLNGDYTYEKCRPYIEAALQGKYV